jgi:hypothetical protein
LLVPQLRQCSAQETGKSRKLRSRAALTVSTLIEIEIAHWLFDRAVFRFFQPFREFTREHVFFDFFGVHRCAEFRFDGVFLCPQETRRIIQIDGGWANGHSVRENDAERPIDGQLCATAGALDFERFMSLVCHGHILRLLGHVKRMAATMPNKLWPKQGEKSFEVEAALAK